MNNKLQDGSVTTGQLNSNKIVIKLITDVMLHRFSPASLQNWIMKQNGSWKAKTSSGFGRGRGGGGYTLDEPCEPPGGLCPNRHGWGQLECNPFASPLELCVVIYSSPVIVIITGTVAILTCAGWWRHLSGAISFVLSSSLGAFPLNIKGCCYSSRNGSVRFGWVVAEGRPWIWFDAELMCVDH